MNHQSQNSGKFSLLATTIMVVSMTQMGVIAAPPSNVVVPGTGVQLMEVGDDFEDESWEFFQNGPKSSEDIDEIQRLPLGRSANNRWYEGAKRGYPDIVKRVPTPPGGIPGSQGALLLRSLKTGIPGKLTLQMQQDDFIANVQNRIGGTIPVSQSPSATTRVFLPAIEEWEMRNGPHFAFRVAVETTIKEKPKFFLGTSQDKAEVYWPGLFIVRDSRRDSSGEMVHNLHFRVRADRNGGDFRGPDIETTGWWTLGISVSPDGVFHYFAKPGIDDITIHDHIASALPYSYRCERFRTFFYNVVNMDDGKSWSTPFVVDDPKVYAVRTPARTARR